MNHGKRVLLVDRLRNEAEPQLVPIAVFFDGNDDPGSIGCNLLDHPGIEKFRDVFTSLVGRPDVEAVYARISELDPGFGSWPFADTVFVVGNIPLKTLEKELADLEPDEVGVPPPSAAPDPLAGSRILMAWWD
jgi:hypothetical protein